MWVKENITLANFAKPPPKNHRLCAGRAFVVCELNRPLIFAALLRFVGKVLQEYELTKKLEEEAVESAISLGLDFDENGQVSVAFHLANPERCSDGAEKRQKCETARFMEIRYYDKRSSTPPIPSKATAV